MLDIENSKATASSSVVEWRVVKANLPRVNKQGWVVRGISHPNDSFATKSRSYCCATLCRAALRCAVKLTR